MRLPIKPVSQVRILPGAPLDQRKCNLMQDFVRLGSGVAPNDLAHGGSVIDYISGTEAKSPQLLPREARQAVYAAIDAFCP